MCACCWVSRAWCSRATLGNLLGWTKRTSSRRVALWCAFDRGEPLLRPRRKEAARAAEERAAAVTVTVRTATNSRGLTNGHADRTLLAREGRRSSIYPSKFRPRRTKHRSRVKKHEELYVSSWRSPGVTPPCRAV